MELDCFILLAPDAVPVTTSSSNFKVSLLAAVWAQALPMWATVKAQANATALGTIAFIRLDIESLQKKY
ncbi:MAG: hypothetical protein ACKOEU_12145 [Limnohabitans sp.]